MHMASFDSQIPIQGQNPFRVNIDVENVNVLSSRSSGFTKNKNHSVLSSSSILEVEEDQNHQWFHEDQETLIKSRNLADDSTRLSWAYRHFKTFDNYASDRRLEIRDTMNCSGNISAGKNNDPMISCCERGSEEDRLQKQRVFWDYVVKACEDHSLVETVLLETELFIDVAFCKQGASSIIKLIKKLKKSDHAFTVTKILSTRFLDMTTHPIARIVIQKCFFFFGSQPNEILYEKAMHHFDVLAVHEVGCKSLNDCIDTISGEQRAWLLNQIADVADYLSDHPYGNYVVQNVLCLRDSQVNAKILRCLRGQFIHLAQDKDGSRVVEKCMESSNLGLICVVKEILHNPTAPFLLAQHQFGNYVIQKALKKTMNPGFIRIYFALVRSLEPHCKELNRTKGGKNVIRLIKKPYST